MTENWLPSSWRRKTHEGLAPERAPRDPRGAAPKAIRVVFFPLRETTLATVVTTALNGHDRWDRRDGTFTCQVPMWELVGLTPRQQARLLLQAALESLSE